MEGAQRGERGRTGLSSSRMTRSWTSGAPTFDGHKASQRRLAPCAGRRGMRQRLGTDAGQQPGAARPCRRPGEAVSAAVERAGQPAPSGSRGPAPGGPACWHEAQGAPAPRTTGRSWWGFDCSTLPAWRGFASPAAEPRSGRREPRPVRRAAHAVLAHGDASVRQHVLAQPPPTRLGRHRRGCDLIRGRCLGLQGPLALGQRAEAVRAAGHPEAGRGPLAPGRLAPVDRLTVHDPVCVPAGLIDERDQGGLGPCVAARGPAPDGQRRARDQAVGP